MTEWLSPHLAPFNEDVLLWLRAPDGADAPIGQLVGRYQKSEFFEGFCEKTATGNLNTGLQQDLVTHFAYLDEGPEYETI